MGTLLKYWWWRVYVFRKDKFKLTFNENITWKLGDVAVNSELNYVMYIGKGYWILTKYAEIDLG
jgi:hypothetical protein